jgi:hypothetical protein
MGGDVLTGAGETWAGSGVAAMWVWFSIQVVFFFGSLCKDCVHHKVSERQSKKSADCCRD